MTINLRTNIKSCEKIRRISFKEMEFILSFQDISFYDYTFILLCLKKLEFELFVCLLKKMISRCAIF